MVDWRQATDLLRCSPKFFGEERYDCVMIQLTGSKIIFGRLVFLFEWTGYGQTYPLALIHPFDVDIGAFRNTDRHLGFYRVKVKPRKKSEVFSVHSIIRGAVAVRDSQRDDEFIIMDTLDADMYLRLQGTL